VARVRHLGNSQVIKFEILNSAGAIVLRGNVTEKTVVSTSDFYTGAYLLKLENGKTFEFRKIVKDR
jgi:hypothetical protein